MLSYQFYLVLHLVGIFMILSSLGGITLHMINGGTRTYNARKWAGIFHGVGLLIALVGGFGLLARLGIMAGWPLWVWTKLGVWLVLGGLPALLYRKANLSKSLWFLILILAGLAAYMAVYKPM